MEYLEFLHPANAEELANIAQETGAEVLHRRLRASTDLRDSRAFGGELLTVLISPHHTRIK